MEPEKKEKLKEMLGLRGLWPAVDEDTGVPQLSRVRNQPGLGYIHVDTFIEKLEEQNLAIDTHTLEITVALKEAPAPTPPPKTEDKPATTETPPTKVYSKAMLEKMTWEEIRTAAKKDPDVPGNKSKVELIKLLTGRPIL